MDFDFAVGDLIILNDSRHRYAPGVYKVLNAPKNINNPRSLCTIQLILEFNIQTRQWIDRERIYCRTLAIKYIRRKPVDYMQIVRDNYLLVNTIPGYF